MLDAVLGRDEWLTPRLRGRLVAVARVDAQWGYQDDTTRMSVRLSAIRVLRALGEDGDAGVDPLVVRAGCTGRSGHEVAPFAAASRLLVELGQPACAWTPEVEAAMVAAGRTLRERVAIDRAAAVVLRNVADAAASAPGSPRARDLLAETRALARAVLAGAGAARLPSDVVDPSAVRILTEVLPPGEPPVLARRIQDELVRSLAIPVRHWESGTARSDPAEPA